MAERPYSPKPERGPLGTRVEIHQDATFPEVQDTWLHVGNTGLSLRYLKDADGESWKLDYTPEGADRDKGHRMKYAAVFAHAFLALLDWLEDPAHLEEAGLPGVPGRVEDMTNGTMKGFLANLLGEHLKTTAEEPENDQFFLELDLRAVAGDKALRERLTALSARALSQDYEMSD